MLVNPRVSLSHALSYEHFVLALSGRSLMPNELLGLNARVGKKERTKSLTSSHASTDIYVWVKNFIAMKQTFHRDGAIIPSRWNFRVERTRREKHSGKSCDELAQSSRFFVSGFWFLVSGFWFLVSGSKSYRFNT